MPYSIFQYATSELRGELVEELYKRPNWQQHISQIHGPLDPVSILDRGAKWGKFKGYPHTYTDFA